MASPTGITAILVAGGFSTRMKQLKPLLRIHGATVLERAIATFVDAGIDEAVVVVGHRAAELLPIIERAGARGVVNPCFEGGMYTSVVAGVRALGGAVQAAFVLPADMPAVKPRTVELLAREWRETGAEVVYPSFDAQRGHPPLLSARLFPEVLRHDGRGGLRHVLASHEARAVELDVLDEGVLIDLDTPEDYRRAQEICVDRSVPTRAECDAVLSSLRARRSVVLHGRAVARVALRLACRLEGAGLRIDTGLLDAAALLHDVAKGIPDHAHAGARILDGLGFRRVAALVGTHMDLDVGGLDEAAILYLADKVVRGESLVRIEERFLGAEAQFLGDAAAMRAIARRRVAARAIAAAVEARLGPGWWEALRDAERRARPPAEGVEPPQERHAHA
jgi:CTP:molybdopterin cytidylyltransferase MocA